MRYAEQLSKVINSTDVYSWQESYRARQNERYSNDLQQVYKAVAGVYNGTPEQLQLHIDALPKRYLRKVDELLLCRGRRRL